MSNKMVFVTRGNWSVSFTGPHLGQPKYTLNVSRHLRINGRYVIIDGNHHGKLFDTQEKAQSFAYTRGYLQLYSKSPELKKQIREHYTRIWPWTKF